MTEIKIYGALLAALLAAAYVSWTAGDTAGAAERVTVFDSEPELIERIEFFTTTQTITFGFRGEDRDRYPWFELIDKDRTRTRAFAGNQDTPELIEQFAPLEALRSLGKNLNDEELSTTKLDAPERRLVVTSKNRSKTFDVGGRTNGARDHYVRAAGSEEVFLLASGTLSDLQFPEGKYMQRRLRNEPLKEVARLVLKAGSQTRTALQKNRLSPTDAFWATEEQPEEPNEALKTFISKLDRISAMDYLTDEEPWTSAEPVLTVAWYGEDDEPLGSVTLSRDGSDKSAKYYARSSATRAPVEVSPFTAEIIEEDLPTLFE